MFRKFLILIFIFILFSGSSAYAQVQSSDVTLTLYPNNPKVNESVKASVFSYALDLKNAYFVWKINDEIKLTGIGKTSFLFTLENINSNTELAVEIEGVGGQNITKSITIAGSDLDMLWEAVDSYAPPFYKGKILASRESAIKITAIPSLYSKDQKVSPNTLFYKWEKDGNPQQADSGFGKSYFLYKNSFLDKKNEIEVTVSDINKESVAKDSIAVTLFDPKILFYTKNSSGINLNKIVDNNFFVKNQGETISVVPYFFSPKNLLARDLDISWFINDEKLPNTLSKNEIIIKPNEGESGQATIKVIIINLKTLFQELQKEITVNF